MSEIDPGLHDIDQTDVLEVEQKLGLRILSDGTFFMADHLTDDEERTDVRKVLYAAGSVALREGVSSADLQHDPSFGTIRWLQSQVHIANNLLAAEFGQHEARSANPTRRDRFQGRLMRGMYHHAQTLPLSYYHAALRGEAIVLNDNLLVVSPTGTGKTVIEAMLLHDAGVGEGMKGLVVVADQALHRQYRGDTGDNTFRRWFGEDVEISSFWQYDKEAGGALQIVTKQSIERAIEANALDISNIDMVVVDEGHIGLEPKMMAHLNSFARVYYFTATPAYSLDRDLRKMFRHVEVGTLTDCIYEGIVNDVELYTFRAKSKEEAEMMAARLAYDDIKGGRQAVVYCQPGERAKQAEFVADQINQLQAKDNPDGEPTKLAAHRLSGYESSPESIIERYEAGDIRAVTTVGMMGQGYNGNINTAILLGPKTSPLQVLQRIGRAVRPNDEFRTRLIEILYEKESLTIWNVLGLDEIEQGRILEVDRDNWIPAIDGDLVAERDEAPLLTTIPDELRDALVVNQPVGRMVLSGRAFETMTDMGEGFASASALAEAGGVSLRRLQDTLDREGFHYVGVWTPDEENTNKYVRWYEPAAVAYLEENPIPVPDGQEGEITIYGIMDRYDVSKDTVELIIQKNGVNPVRRTSKRYRTANYYTPEDVEAIGATITAIPLAEESDITVGTLKQELGEKFVLKCFSDPARYGEPVYKRRFAGHGFKGFDFHLTEVQADLMRKAFNEALATDADISFREIAALAGVHPGTIDHGVTENEKAIATLKRATPTARPGYHLPRKVGLEIVERFRVRPLPAHLVTLKMVAERLSITMAGVRSVVRRNMDKPDSVVEFINLGGSNAATACMPWSFLKEMEEKYGLDEGVEPIDYARVAKDERVTQEEWSYSTEVQAKYVDASKLSVQPEKTWESVTALAQGLQCTTAALSVLAVLAGRKEEELRVKEGVSYMHSELNRRIKVLRDRPYSRHEDWIASSSLYSHSKYRSDEIHAVLAVANVDPDDRRLGLDSHGMLDVCYRRSAVRGILQTVERNRRRAH